MISKTVTVEFVLVGSNNSPITREDAECMSVVAESIRLSARLVDMPCQDMHTSAFVEVNTSQLSLTIMSSLVVAEVHVIGIIIFVVIIIIIIIIIVILFYHHYHHHHRHHYHHHQLQQVRVTSSGSK